MRRLILRWLALLVFVAVIATACVLLGRWQLARLEERRVTNEAIQTRESGAPVDPEQVLGAPITEADEWQRVELRGTYDPAGQVVVRLRTHDRQPGIEVVTPLRTADGLNVLVNRGFLATPRDRPPPSSAPAPPPGEVTVIGFVRANERGGEQATIPIDGQTRLVNAQGIQTALRYPVVDGWLSLESSTPAEPELQPLLLPELSDGPHFWYAVQWFLFACIGLAGLVVFVRGDIRERRSAGRPEVVSATPPGADTAEAKPAAPSGRADAD